MPASEFNASSSDAKRPGIYAWWADEPARQLIEDTLHTDANPLIYIGQAGGGRSRETLWKRVHGKHLNGTIRNSTLRWSLTAILMTMPEFAAAHSDPCVVRRSERLSAWMREHLEVAIIPVDGPESVKPVEDAMIAHYDPPLNGTRRGRLTELRRLLKAAREMKGCPPPSSQA